MDVVVAPRKTIHHVQETVEGAKVRHLPVHRTWNIHYMDSLSHPRSAMLVVVIAGHGKKAGALGMAQWLSIMLVKASRPLIRVLVINDNHYGLTFLFEL
jgi:molybdopterin synthase catalytic subunit